MGPLILAWLIGEGIIVWRAAAQQHRPPAPGTLLAASALFALCALAAEYPPAKGPATLFAFGVDIAILMKVLPGGSAPIRANASPIIKGAPPKKGVTVV